MNNEFIIPKPQFDFLLSILPTPKQKKNGRKRIPKQALLKGILQVLYYDKPWNHIDNTGCSWSPCYRYFNELQRSGKLHLIFKCLSSENLDKSICSSDTSSMTSFRFKSFVSFDGKHKKYSTKVSLICDKKGIPFDVEFDKGSRHDLAMLQKHIDNRVLKSNSELNLDKGYTKLELRSNLRKKKVRVNMEYKKGDYKHKRGPKHKLKQDIYKKRFLVEQLFAKLKVYRRVRTRKDHKVSMFKAFVYLALIIILFNLGV